VIKSRKIRHVWWRREAVGKHEEKYHLDDLGVNGTIILKWVLNKSDETVWTGLVSLRIWTSDGLL
jgi:hypothetical protein